MASSAKEDPKRHAPEEVDAYLNALPDDVKDALQRVRGFVHQIAPEVTERVSYGIPIFRLTRDLVGMGARGGDCSFYTMSPPLAKAMKDDLKKHKVSGATIHFAPDQPLPKTLLSKIIKARLIEFG